MLRYENPARARAAAPRHLHNTRMWLISVFDDEDENKLTYTEIHQQYKQLVRAAQTRFKCRVLPRRAVTLL